MLITSPSSRSREISTSLRFAAFGFAASPGAEAKGLAFLAGGDTSAWYSYRVASVECRARVPAFVPEGPAEFSHAFC